MVITLFSSWLTFGVLFPALGVHKSMDAQTGILVLTLALAFATVWLAFETRQMAKSTRDLVELQGRPYLAFAGLRLVFSPALNLLAEAQGTSARLALQLSNPGQTLVTYEVDDIEATFEGVKLQNPTFENRGGVIHPKDGTLFFYPSITTPSPFRPGVKGEVRFKIRFWSSPLREHRLDARLRYVVTSIEPGLVEWIYLEGPKYT
jgi:hypothetical protein